MTESENRMSTRMISLAINNTPVEVPEGSSVLAAARQTGIHIPTLCNFPDKPGHGSCRMCLVEVEGVHVFSERVLTTSCTLLVKEGMRVLTNSQRVRQMRLATLGLILSEHDGDCRTCNRNRDCQLLALTMELGINREDYPGQKPKRVVDQSTPALYRDSGKCVRCRRCVIACHEMQGVTAIWPQGRGFDGLIGPAFKRPLADVTCVQCGQCGAACPAGGIMEQDHIQPVWKALADPNITVTVQTAPAIRAALGECFGLPPGTLVTGKMTAVLRRLGFHAVFDTSFSADLTVMEESMEFLERCRRQMLLNETMVPLPMFTSCSAGWVNYIESHFPSLLPHLSTCKSPMSMMGAMIKSYWAQRQGIDPEKIINVAVMPCTAKKSEAKRPQLTTDGLADVDYVLTTRELGRMIHEAGIDFLKLPEQGPESEMDAPLGLASGAGNMFANTGGTLEATLRTVYEMVIGRPAPPEVLRMQAIMGLDGIKEASLKLEGVTSDWAFLEGMEIQVAVAHGLRNAKKVCQAVKQGEEPWHFIEVMCCPGGCIGGGGQPRYTTDAVRRERLQAIYAEDESKAIRTSHNNTDIQRLYYEFLGRPFNEMSRKYLHTHYTAKQRK